MTDKILIGLTPPNFNKILTEYENMWDNHINWVKESLTHVKEICNKNASDEGQTPVQKKNKKKRQTGLTTDSKIRPSINILNTIKNNKNARVTRSTSRILKQLNIVKEGDNLLNNDLDSIIKQDQLIEEEILCDSKFVSKEKVSSLKFNDENVLKKTETDKISLSALKVKSDKKLDKVDKTLDKLDKNSETIDNNKIETLKVSSTKKVSIEENNTKVSEKNNETDLNDMHWSPAKIEVKTNQIPLIVTEPAKLNVSEDEWLTEDESNIKANMLNKSKQKKNSLKRGAIKKSELRPTPKIKRNKTNEFSTPQSLKKFSKIPYKIGSASKQLRTLTKSTLLPTPLIKQNEFVSKLKKPEEKNIESSSQTKNTNLITSNSSSLSHLSLKSCPSTIQQPNKVLTRNLSNNSESKQRCFAESTLKQKLEEEKKRKLLEEKIAKEEEAKKKKENFLKQRILETKAKREERERKVREGKLLHEKEAEAKKTAEQKKRFEANLKEKELLRLAELKKKQLVVQKVQEQKKSLDGYDSTAKNIFETPNLEESHDLKVFETIEKAIENEKLNNQDQIIILNDKKPEENLNIESDPIIEVISNEKQLESIGLQENNKKEEKLEISNSHNKVENENESIFDSLKETSLGLINLKLEMTNDSSMSAGEVSIKDTNQTFIKDLKTNALSSTFIKPVEQIDNPQSYDISDLRSDDDDDDGYLYKSVSKKRPMWTRGDDFMKSIQYQYGLNSRARENKIKSIFATIESIVPLDEIFSENKEFVSKKYERRTSSACWSSPPATYIDKSYSQFFK